MLFSSGKPTINSISCDTTEWLMHEESEERRLWLSNRHDAVLFRLFNTPPTFPYDFSDIEAARKFYSSQSIDNGGVMLSVDFQRAGGIDVMKGVFKYRSPQPDSMAMYFVGILAFLFRDFAFQINTESLEIGTTGTREAAVSLILNEKLSEDREPILVNTMEEMFENMRSRPLCKTPSDREEYDASFPNHPLSKVRILQQRIIDTITVDSIVKQSQPYSANAIG
jgi:hypothetical protein